MLKKIVENKRKITYSVNALFSIYSFFLLIARGYESENGLSMDWFLAGIVSGSIAFGILAAAGFITEIWSRLMNFLSEVIRKYPKLRMALILPNTFFAFYASYLFFIHTNFDLTLKIVVIIYAILLAQASTISLVQEDLEKERTKLSNKISREMRIQNPQAAISSAFVHFEDHLNKRISGGPKLFGNALIKAAYDGEKSKLVYMEDGKDYTDGLYKLMAGAYALLRNPRHHKIVGDDERKAQTLIALAELLIEYVDNSQERVSQQGNSPSKSPAN